MRIIIVDDLKFMFLGGTDIISCFMGQNPTIPVYKGEIQSRNLGMAVESWDKNGIPENNDIKTVFFICFIQYGHKTLFPIL